LKSEGCGDLENLGLASTELSVLTVLVTGRLCVSAQPEDLGFRSLGLEVSTSTCMHALVDAVRWSIFEGTTDTASIEKMLLGRMDDMTWLPTIYAKDLCAPVPVGHSLFDRYLRRGRQAVEDPPNWWSLHYEWPAGFMPESDTLMTLVISNKKLQSMTASEIEREAVYLAMRVTSCARAIAESHRSRYGKDHWWEKRPPGLVVLVTPRSHPGGLRALWAKPVRNVCDHLHAGSSAAAAVPAVSGGAVYDRCNAAENPNQPRKQHRL